jgi:hypothetical protein
MYSVADPGYFDKDPDQIFHFDTNPDPTAVQKLSIIKMYGTVLKLEYVQCCHFDTDPNPTFHSDTDLDLTIVRKLGITV